ncbi:valine--tRNA ligase-like isoform X2 [Pomacea canaliculata]|uniref:valine--tRNA ligase-like isoform X2 n=1 Tax=Pomacea canaliculata TaxID=400727 RepID=UPI000D73701B|nr:valine--tRNA ligase-like isoform X2 [Pomacea canaliculata]
MAVNYCRQLRLYKDSVDSIHVFTSTLKHVPLQAICHVLFRNLTTLDVKSFQSTIDDSAVPLAVKKDTSVPLPPVYIPHFVEKDWYQWWLHKGYFTAETGQAATSNQEKFVLLLPPPNVTGVLHLGHALTISIQDALIRWHRMLGHKTLWVPGTDHAGIATQVMVEKMLWAMKKQTRHDLGRAEFVSTVQDWKQKKGSIIKEQMSKLGASFDWSKEFFTLDDRLSQAVTDAFINLHEKNKIYRDTQLVNWCCSLQSSISDIEVDNVKIDKPTKIPVPGYTDGVDFGILSLFAYPIEDSHEEVVVSTTRLETILGDTAIAVHPNDTRYTHLIGRKVWHPLCSRSMPIIADSFVDREFGTGVVKITPGHSYVDFEVARRHNLAVLSVIDDKGNIHGEAGESFIGMPRFLARNKVCLALKDLGLYRGEMPHDMMLPLCSRSGDVIEPLLKEQWFLNCKDLADQAIRVAENGELTFSAPHHKAVWFEWLRNARNWCLSRQLWWGHRIPAYNFQTEKGNVWIVARSQEDAVKKFCKQRPSCTYFSCSQDEDVLDTWFSSALLPFSVFGWPQETDNLREFYPLSLLETGRDILFFWVARMVMLGLELTGSLPFRHELRKKQGSMLQNKMKVETSCDKQSKYMNDGIPECGADALRFTLCSHDFKVDEIRVSVEHMKVNRFFCNKIWQAFRFVQQHLGADFVPLQQFKLSGKEDTVDLWILSRLSELVALCNASFISHDLQKAISSLHTFWLTYFCDIYLESCKGIFQQDDLELHQTVRHILYLIMHTFLRAMAPFMPFLAEELYQRLPMKGINWPESVCIASYPLSEEYPWRDETAENTMALVQNICNRILSKRHACHDLKSAIPVDLIVADQHLQANLKGCIRVIKRLTRADPVHITGPFSCSVDCEAIVITEKVHLLVHLQKQVDYSKELKRLSLKHNKILFSKEKVAAKLSKLQSTGKGHLSVTTKLQEKEASLQTELKTIVAAINSLKRILESKS